MVANGEGFGKGECARENGGKTVPHKKEDAVGDDIAKRQPILLAHVLALSPLDAPIGELDKT